MTRFQADKARRQRALSLTLIGASLAIQAAMSSYWARATGASQDAALLAIMLVHVALLAAALWRLRSCAVPDDHGA